MNGIFDNIYFSNNSLIDKNIIESLAKNNKLKANKESPIDYKNNKHSSIEQNLKYSEVITFQPEKQSNISLMNNLKKYFPVISLLPFIIGCSINSRKFAATFNIKNSTLCLFFGCLFKY